MGLLGSKEFNSLEELFWEQIGDLYDAEKRLTGAIPKMANAAHSRDLQETLDEEKQADGKLTQIAERFVNEAAAARV